MRRECRLRHTEFAHDDRPCRLKAIHDYGVLGGNHISEHHTPSIRSRSCDPEKVLHRDGNPMQRTSELASPGLIIELPSPRFRSGLEHF